ncbi:Putative uncharacterized protein [Moritella viscosa]|nr:Putative uncharacterized protein [Moritella viscosa]SHO19287.1 Putative uncharacterized protein [Moritella viscosa]
MYGNAVAVLFVIFTSTVYSERVPFFLLLELHAEDKFG